MEKKKKYPPAEDAKKPDILQEPAVGYQPSSIVPMENVYLNIPKDDLKLVKELAQKMGWVIETKESLLYKYTESRPENAELTEEDILSEINKVRYDFV